MKKIFLILTLMLTCWQAASAYDFMVNGIAYDKNSDGNTVMVTYTALNSSYDSHENYANAAITVANIPETVSNGGKTYTVTSIGEDAFSNVTSLESVTIPNTVTKIGYSAFVNCTNLKRVVLSNSLTTIEGVAFGGCPFESISIPNSVTEIGPNAFSFCSNLKSITLPNKLEVISTSSFYKCGLLEKIVIPNSVKQIGRYALADCNSLTSIDIPNSVTRIEEYAFPDCKSLKSLTIPESVEFIGYNIVNSCESLETINYNALNCTFGINIAKLSFLGQLNSLKTINIGDKIEKVPGYFVINAPDHPITVTIGKSVKSIDANFLNNITTVKTVNFNAENCESPASADAAWLRNQKVASLKLGATVKSIPDYLAYGQSELTSVTLPMATYIGKNAFTGCSAMRDVYASYKDPVTLSTEVFDNTIYNNAILHVPTGADKYYKARAYWKNFGTIWDDNGQGGGPVGGGGPDVNGDGVVDVSDVTIVINAILGK
ncbi:MAG: leucine-rich repeat protein [Bacteroidales bacterium]|nr:leucine-rich repeat protein [Candidatus Sodaliphilus limicaballi]